jgi:hypothetical protein
MIDTDEKEKYVEKLCDAIVNNMDRDKLEQVVWDKIYDELIFQEWVDLLMMGEDYGIETEA